jgi:dTMP kinase
MLDVIRSIILYRWKRADFIVFVRYLIGTAYLPAPFHKMAYLFFYRLVPKSDYMIFIEINPEEALRRIENRSEESKEVFESLDKLYEVRDRAKELTSMGGWKIMNGNQPRRPLHGKIIAFLAP